MDSFFIQEMSSAITFLTVLIHCELMPRGGFLNIKKKKGASKQSSLEYLHMWMVQFDLSRQLRCHQNLNAIESSPALSRELLPVVVAKGVRRIRCMIEIFQSIPKSGLSLLQKNSNSWHIIF